MKRIIIISSFAATALFTLTGGVQAQNSIEQVLKNIETNNKELQANAQLIPSQKLESKTYFCARRYVGIDFRYGDRSDPSRCKGILQQCR